MPSKKVESLAEKVLRLKSEAKVIRAELSKSHGMYFIRLSAI
jgi:hypothetical protein